MKYDVVVAGYTCVDIFPQFNRDIASADITSLFKPGKLIEIDGMDFVLGGVVPNTGLAMNRFGRKVCLNGLIGNDFIGKMAKEILDASGISGGFAITEEAGTAFSIVLAPPGIDRIFLESPGCNKIFDTSFIDFDAVSESGIFHFGYPPLLRKFYLDNGRQLTDLFTKVRNMGVITSLDFSLPDPGSESGKVDWPEIMKNTLPFVDIFLPSLEEVVQIMMPGKYNYLQSINGKTGADKKKAIIDLAREAGRLIIDSGVKVLLIKAGENGIYLRTGNIVSPENNFHFLNDLKEWNNRELWCDAYYADSTRVINSSGAGDTAVAAFLSAIINGEDPGLSVKYAAIAGRNSLYCKNVFRDISNWQKMEEELGSEINEIVNF